MFKIRLSRRILIPQLLLALILGTTPAIAADEKSEKDNLDFLDNIDYPELQVVPKASERLDVEAQYERDGGSWLNEWTFLLSGASTIAAATLTGSALGSNIASYQQNYVSIGQMVGGATLGIGLYYAISQPYIGGWERVKKSRGPGKRQALMRERLSEEALEKPANQISALSSIVVLTNVTTNALLASCGSSAQYGWTAMVISALPLIFPNPYVTNWEKQKEYKHKIYTPLPQTSISVDPYTGETKRYAGLQWTW